VLQEVSGWSDFQLHQFAAEHEAVLGDFTLAPSALMQSAKMGVMDGLLKRLRDQGSRALVFSQWTSILDIMQWFLDEVGGAGAGPLGLGVPRLPGAGMLCPAWR
jgi:SWI/SNF-related matrix-associated actin-dependent regulator 1 of chromatin subfamily A